MGLIKWFKKRKHDKEKVQQEQIDKIKKEKVRKKAARKKIIKRQKDTDKAAKTYLGLNMNYHERLEYAKKFNKTFSSTLSNEPLRPISPIFGNFNDLATYKPVISCLGLLIPHISNKNVPLYKLIKLVKNGMTAGLVHNRNIPFYSIAGDMFEYSIIGKSSPSKCPFVLAPQHCNDIIKNMIAQYYDVCKNEREASIKKSHIKLTNTSYIYGTNKDTYKQRGLVQGNNEEELKNSAYFQSANAVINIKRTSDLHGHGDEYLDGNLFSGVSGSGSWDLNSTPIYFGTGVYIPSLDKSSKHAKKS